MYKWLRFPQPYTESYILAYFVFLSILATRL